MERTIRVELGSRSYDVRIGSGLLSQLGRAVAALPRARQAVVISDSNVARLHAPAGVESLRAAGLSANLIDFPAGEPNKTLATVSTILDRLFAIQPAIDRDTVIVAVGGGVTGDIAGLVAALALRGLRCVQCPTTLLADVDSSVGGKTGVDHAEGKNLIGAFHQPSAVLIDVDALKTLTPDELRNGLAECVKHGVIRDVTLLDLIEQRADAILDADTDVMIDLVARNVAVKAAVVSADERESGVRAHLNFGHTVGHAIETLGLQCGADDSSLRGEGVSPLRPGGILPPQELPKPSSTENQLRAGRPQDARARCPRHEYTHGQVVALGMVAAMRIAVARKLIGEDFAMRVESLLQRLGLPVRVPWPRSSRPRKPLAAGGRGHKRRDHGTQFDASKILNIMTHDKKARAGRIRMVLPTAPGKVDVFEDLTAKEIQDSLAYLQRP